MYIRTRTGNVLYDVMLNVKWTAKIDNGLKYYDFDGDYAGLVICENNFKSQGDNLSDVLEVKDIIIFDDNTSTIYDGIKGVIDSFNIFDMIKKVVPHEQYMKLAQEIK
jgi:hypothetical protein